MRIYVNQIEKKITFRIKTRYCLELIMPVVMKLRGNIKSKITKDENGETLSSLEITEEVYVHCNIVNINY